MISMFKTNEYFNGKVLSIAFQNNTEPNTISEQEKKATVGVMAAGEYVFNTADKEKMTVVSGQLIIKFDGHNKESTYTPGQSFEVVANSTFNVRVLSDTAYLCEYG